MEPTFDAGSWWAYAMVFLAAATPVLEVLVVIPAAILAGLSPVPTVLLALTGNLSTVALAALLGGRIISWQQRRRPERNREEPSRRSQRARELGQRWGVPGLAFVAPVTTGTHIATLAALATGAGTRRVLQWMTAGLTVWAIAAAVAAAAGLEAFR